MHRTLCHLFQHVHQRAAERADWAHSSLHTVYVHRICVLTCMKWRSMFSSLLKLNEAAPAFLHAHAASASAAAYPTMTAIACHVRGAQLAARCGCAQGPRSRRAGSAGRWAARAQQPRPRTAPSPGAPGGWRASHQLPLLALTSCGRQCLLVSRSTHAAGCVSMLQGGSVLRFCCSAASACRRRSTRQKVRCDASPVMQSGCRGMQHRAHLSSVKRADSCRGC